MNTTHSTKKKILAQALGITAAAVLGVLANAGTAAADGHNIVDEDGTWGAVDGAEQRGEDRLPAVNEGDMVYGVHSIDTSADVPGANTPVASYPAPSSYPADPSWPGGGWGVADN